MRELIWLGILLAGVSGSARVAQADQATPGAGASAAVAEGAQDASAASSFAAPTALTAAKGAFGVQVTELLLVGISYAPTDRLLFSASALVPIDDEAAGLFTGKAQLLRGRRWRVAAHGAVLRSARKTSSYSAATLGAAATLCLNPSCSSHTTGYGAAALTRATGGAGDGFTFTKDVPPAAVLAGAVALSLTRRSKLLFEADSAYLGGDRQRFARGALVWYGVRVSSAQLGLDLGLVLPLTAHESALSELFPLGVPVVKFSYQSR